MNLNFLLPLIALAVDPLTDAMLAAADLEPACVLSATDVTGTLHADTTFNAPMTKPRAKEKQSIRCGSTPVALYLLDYPTAKEASLAIELTGAMLWGGPEPTADHPDLLLRKGTVVAIVSSPAPRRVAEILVRKHSFALYASQSSPPAAAAQANRPQLDDISQQDLAAIRSQACGVAAYARYCAVLKEFANGTPVRSTGSPLAGSSLIFDGTRFAEELSYVMITDSSGIYGTLQPSNAEERAQVAPLLKTLNAGKKLDANEPVMAHVRTLGEAKRRPAVELGRSAVWQSKSYRVVARKTRNAVVVIEAPVPATVFYVGIFQ